MILIGGTNLNDFKWLNGRTKFMQGVNRFTLKKKLDILKYSILNISLNVIIFSKGYLSHTTITLAITATIKGT